MNTALPQLPAWRIRFAQLQARFAKAWQDLAPLRARAWASLQRLAPVLERVLASGQCLLANARPKVTAAWQHFRQRCPSLTVTHLLLAVIALLLVANLFHSPSANEAVTAQMSATPTMVAQNIQSLTPDEALATRRSALHNQITEQNTKLDSLRSSKELLEIDQQQQQREADAYALNHAGVLVANTATAEGFKAANDSNSSDGEQAAGAIIGFLGLMSAIDNGTATITVQAEYDALQSKVTSTGQKIANLQRQITLGETALVNLNRELAALKP